MTQKDKRTNFAEQAFLCDSCGMMVKEGDEYIELMSFVGGTNQCDVFEIHPVCREAELAVGLLYGFERRVADLSEPEKEALMGMAPDVYGDLVDSGLMSQVKGGYDD